MTPLMAMAAFTSGDSNQSSSRSVMLMVMSRVTSPTVLTPMPLYRQARRTVSKMSVHLVDPSFGGVAMSNGPRMSARPSIHASHFGMASASFFENFEISSWFRLASS